MFIDLENKVVVITGASRGIGKKLAESFAREKVKLVINYKNSLQKALDIYDDIIKYNKNVILVKADITKYEDVLNLYNTTIQTYGTVDILINNAGILYDDKVIDMDLKNWKRVIDVNLNGTFICSKIFSTGMMHQKYGKIINIASIKGQDGSAMQANYAASKAGVIALTKSLAKELATYNVSVNAICPGFIITDINKECEAKYKKAVEENLFSLDHCMKDLINFVIYMSSNKMCGVTGRVFNIDSRIK